MKNFLKSKGIVGALITMAVMLLGYAGYDIKEPTDVLIQVGTPIVAALILMYKRITTAFKGLDTSGWITAIIGVIAAFYSSVTGDDQTVHDTLPLIFQFVAAAGTILSAFGIHVATERVTI